jgi:hypothetical protein
MLGGLQEEVEEYSAKAVMRQDVHLVWKYGLEWFSSQKSHEVITEVT